MAHPVESVGARDTAAPIEAVPLRHPGQWAAAVVVVALVGLFVYGAATNPAYRWRTYASYLFDTRVLTGVGYTLALTVLARVRSLASSSAMAWRFDTSAGTK